MIMRPASTEHSIMIHFKPGLVAHLPLEPKLKDQLPIPVSFIFGENDWVPLYEEDAP